MTVPSPNPPFIATVSGQDLLTELKATNTELTSIKLMVSGVPGEVLQLRKDVDRLKLWKSWMSGAGAVITAAFSYGMYYALSHIH